MRNKILRFGFFALALCAMLSCRKYYTERHVNIPDRPEAVGISTFEVVTRVMLIQDLDVEIWIEHPNLANLEAWIESPRGTIVPLFSDIRGEGLHELIFDDEANKPIEPIDLPTGFGPWGGTVQIQEYNPHSLGLFVYDGEDPNGVWKLYVRDRDAGDVGAITLFGLCINGEW